jgi:3-deoxy-D-manno-octulosonic-acid transferase
MERLQKAIPPNEKLIWMHCASLGEFEQGRPVIEELKKNFPAYRILLTFFSPSGYESQKNYPGADWVFYLPLDGPGTAKRFLDITHPSLVIFVKYEFWYFYLKKLRYRNIPLLLISAQFRKDMSFFKWYGGLQQKMLARFDHLFVQDRSSLELLQGIGLNNISSISGDTRFDRVQQIAENAETLPLIERFLHSQSCIVAGSTWPEDEEILNLAWRSLDQLPLKWILAPHEISGKHVNQLKQSFTGAILYSDLVKDPSLDGRVLIVDNVGMLSRLYRYSWLSFVGGGFMKMGVHNVLEPAAFSKPVIIGPYYKKYQEAKGLVIAKGGFVITNETELADLIQVFYREKEWYDEAATSSGKFVKEQSGATKKIMDYIQEKRLLTI